MKNAFFKPAENRRRLFLRDGFIQEKILHDQSKIFEYFLFYIHTLQLFQIVAKTNLRV